MGLELPVRRHHLVDERDDVDAVLGGVVDDLEGLVEVALRPVEIAQERLRRALAKVIAQLLGDLDLARLGDRCVLVDHRG